MVEQFGAGEFVPPEDVEAGAAAIRRWKGLREELERKGIQGLEYVLTYFDRKALARQYLELPGRIIAAANASKPS